MGQGAKGTLAQIAAHHLGVRFEDVAVADPDTSNTGFDSLTGGSRTTYVGDLAIRQASSTLMQQLGDAAADQLRLPVADVGHESGFVVSLTDPSMRKGYAEIVRDSGLPLFVANGRYESERSAALLDPLDVKGDVSVHWHQGAVAVEVEVDLETGKVEILRSHGAAWAGRVINPTRARQQSEGSIIYGIGPALFEETLVMDGQVVNPNLSDYMIPSFLDVPLDLTSSSLEDFADNAEIHGVGEMTIPAVAPAIANAVARAVGARVRELPITAERVLRALPDREPG
jgi:CO/xanthine dehydrogenase Mo-binding subunit